MFGKRLFTVTAALTEISLKYEEEIVHAGLVLRCAHLAAPGPAVRPQRATQPATRSPVQQAVSK